MRNYSMNVNKDMPKSPDKNPKDHEKNPQKGKK